MQSEVAKVIRDEMWKTIDNINRKRSQGSRHDRLKMASDAGLIIGQFIINEKNT